MASSKVTYINVSIKQLVDLLEPKKPREQAYVFSNGRIFYEPKREVVGEVTFGGESVTFGGEEVIW